jgi:hypothetical protein
MNRRSFPDLLKLLSGTIVGAATLHAYYKDVQDISNMRVLEEFIKNSKVLEVNMIANQNSNMELLKDQIVSANKLTNYYKNKLIELADDTRLPDELKSYIYETMKREFDPDFSQPSSTSMASAVQDYLAKNGDSESKVNKLINNFNIDD